MVREAISQTYTMLASRRGASGNTCAYPNQLVLSSGSKVLAIRAEANAPDVQITTGVGAVILQDARFLSTDNIVDLSRLVASCSHVVAIVTEPDATDDALVSQSVNKIHVQDARNSWVEHDKPVVPSFLMLRRQSLHIKISKRIGARRLLMRVAHSDVVWGRVRTDLWRLHRTGRTCVWQRRVDLRCCRPTSIIWGAADTALAWTGASSTARRRLRREPTWSGALVLRLERRLLRWRRRRRWRTLKPWRRLGHLLVGWWALLFLRRWRRRDWTTLATLATHDGAESVCTHPDSWRGSLRRAWVRRADHGVLGNASAGLIELATEMGDFFLIPVQTRGLSIGAQTAVWESEKGTYFCLRVMWFCSIA